MNSPLSREWRDLEWFAACPDLIEAGLANSPGLTPLHELEDRPALLSSLLKLRNPHPHRVGHYVESLVHRWLENSAGVTNVERNLVIRDHKRTVGELDFLFRRGGEIHHLEVALKFFLHHPDLKDGMTRGSSQFPGPNAADNFERKRDRLIHAQLPLGRATFPEVEESLALVKGIIFFRPDQEHSPPLPAGMNPLHRRGVWIRQNESGAFFDNYRFSRGFVMEKPYWLGGLQGPPDGPPPGKEIESLYEELHQRIDEKSRPLLISLADQSDDGWSEVQRVFVVPADWPSV